MLENLKIAIAEKYIQQKLAAIALGMNPGNLSKLIKSTPEEVDNLRTTTLNNLKKNFPEYNLQWILGKSDIKYLSDLPENHPAVQVKSNSKVLGEIMENEMVSTDDDGNTKFYEISPGVYRMKVPLITETAKAGSLTGYADAEYLEDQEYIYTTVFKYHKGRYRAFRVVGDSMDVDRRTTFVHGDIIIGREINREFWKSRFHTHKYPFYAFATKKDGIIFKELISHDVEHGIVTLRSLNEDKDTYPDFKLDLEDVSFVYNIVKREVEI